MNDSNANNNRNDNNSNAQHSYKVTLSPSGPRDGVAATIIIIQKNVFSISKPPTKTKTYLLLKNKVLSKQNLVV